MFTNLFNEMATSGYLWVVDGNHDPDPVAGQHNNLIGTILLLAFIGFWAAMILKTKRNYGAKL